MAGAVDASQIERVVAWIQARPEIRLDNPMPNYDHMGAIITDGVLQAGLRYETVVLPRVRKVQARGEARTTTGFLRLLLAEGPLQVLSWRDAEKPNRALAVARFFQTEGIETARDLRAWLRDDANLTRFKTLRGIGDKTADYFRILVGISASAIDRHLYKFLGEAGVPTQDYSQAQALVNGAAERMGVDYAALDHGIWAFMSARSR